MLQQVTPTNFTTVEVENKSIPLELPNEEMRRWGMRALELFLQHYEEQTFKSVVSIPDHQTIKRNIDESIPWEPTSWTEIFYVLNHYVLNHVIDSAHPRHMAYIPGPGNFPAALADFLSSAFNIFTGTWHEAAGPTEVELVTLKWLRELIGLPESTMGSFVSGGSTANWTGLAVARESFLQNLNDKQRFETFNNLTIYFSDQTHHSIERSLFLLGFTRSQFRIIPTDDFYRIDLAALDEQIDLDKKNHRQPAILVANVGSTNTGSIDSLEGMVDIRNRHDLWLHADAAYGGAAILNKEVRQSMQGIEMVDSLTIDPHKWFFMPYEIGCILVRDGKQLSTTFKHNAVYIEDETDRPVYEVNLQDYGHQQTRNFKALKFWMAIKVFGMSEFARAIDYGLELGKFAETYIRMYCLHLQIVSPAQIGILTFRYYIPGKTELELENLNKQIVEQVLKDGVAMVHTTRLKNDIKVIRMCIINPRTTQHDVSETIKYIECVGDQITATYN